MWLFNLLATVLPKTIFVMPVPGAPPVIIASLIVNAIIFSIISIISFIIHHFFTDTKK